ncbi:MAG: glucose 1-dehydrogenase [Actinomycetota bacterium]
MGRLDGKVAIISGAARGQGEAEARLFAEEGALVVLGDVLDEPGAEVGAEIGDVARYVHLDVRDEGGWQHAVSVAEKEFGPVDVLVNNAGIFRMAPVVDTSVELFQQIIDVNQIGPLLGVRAVVPSMTRAGGGSIVNVSSTNGINASRDTVAYTATKWALRGMTKVMAMELGPLGIRVNSVHPGGIDTDMVRPRGGQTGISATELDARFAGMPLGRIGQAVEIARLVLFLASDESSYSTGSEFVADGGLLAGR